MPRFQNARRNLFFVDNIAVTQALRLGEARAENAQMSPAFFIGDFLDDDHFHLVRADVDAGSYATFH